MTSKDFRRLARENLAGRWGKAALLTLMYILIYGVINVGMSFAGKIDPYIGNVASILIILISPVIGYGFIKALILFRRKEEIGALDFLKLGFQDFKQVWYVTISLLPKYIGPIILMVIAFVGLAFGFFVIFCLAFAPPVDITSQVLSISGGLFWISIFFIVLAMIWLIPVSYKYFFAFYELAYNPDMSSKEIVRTTGEYMKGNRWKLFKLMFTFFGWAILAVIFLGIPIFWFIPYVTIAGIFFYEKVSGRLEGQEEMNQSNNLNPIQYENDVLKENKDL